MTEPQSAVCFQIKRLASFRNQLCRIHTRPVNHIANVGAPRVTRCSRPCPVVARPPDSATQPTKSTLRHGLPTVLPSRPRGRPKAADGFVSLMARVAPGFLRLPNWKRTRFPPSGRSGGPDRISIGPCPDSRRLPRSVPAGSSFLIRCQGTSLVAQIPARAFPTLMASRRPVSRAVGGSRAQARDDCRVERVEGKAARP